jgi:site-specific recombinase XerD
MATINLYLSSRINSITNKSEIYIRFIGGRGFVFRGKSGISIEPERWKAKEGRILIPRLETDLQRELLLSQKRINDLGSHLVESFASADKTKINKDWLKIEIERFWHPDRGRTDEQERGVFDAFERFLGEKPISDNRLRHYKVLGRMLKRYELYRSYQSRNIFKLSFDIFSDSLLRDFEKYLVIEHKIFETHNELFKEVPESKKPGRRGPNTIYGIFQKLRCFILWAIEKGLCNTNPFRGYSMKTPVYGTPIYITLEERDIILHTEFTDRPALAVQRDVFVFQCLVGCRVGDLIKLKKCNRINGAIEYIPRKTMDGRTNTIRVPLNETAKPLLDKYADTPGDQLMPFISQVNYNLALKEIFTIAGINRIVTVINPQTREEEQKPLNEIASSHIARRTFIGNLYKKVKDPSLVGSLSGHKDGSKAFARYRDIDEEIKKDLVKLIE